VVELPGPTQIAVQVDLTSVIESFSDAIVGVSSAGFINSCNRGAVELYGYPSPELIGLDAEVLIPSELRMEEAAILCRVMAGERVEEHRTQRICRDGTRLAVSLTIAPVRDNIGGVAGAVVIARACRNFRVTVLYGVTSGHRWGYGLGRRVPGS
jgi:PAS domain S-box-containing protein